jgi:hypothetical protein
VAAAGAFLAAVLVAATVVATGPLRPAQETRMITRS